MPGRRTYPQQTLLFRSYRLSIRCAVGLKNTTPPYTCEEKFTVYGPDAYAFRHDGVMYRVCEKAGSLLLEKDMYASPFDTAAPVMTLQAGEIRVFVSTDKLKIEVVSDPLGIFTDHSPEDFVLQQSAGKVVQPHFSAPILWGGA